VEDNEQGPHIERRHRRDLEQEPSQLDASWGGISIGVKGSIVVLAVLIMAGTALIMWFLGQQNIHFDDSLNQHMHHMEMLDEQQRGHDRKLAELEVGLKLKMDQVGGEIDKNRSYLREIARICLLTPEQRLKVQQNLTPALKDLLLRGDHEK
jgi:hypothetical protein